MRRTQVYLDDGMYALLKGESAATKKTLSDILRESLQERVSGRIRNILSSADGVFGVWRDKDTDVDEHIRAMRKDRKI